MHPSKAIRGRVSQLLAGRRIVVGVSGSIAAVEVPRIVRELIRHGAEVRAVMSPEATRLVSPEAIQFATGHPPVLQLSGDVEHVTELGPGEGRADLLLIAPATANTISKIAHGIDDTPVTSFASVALGGGVPILVAPAMHEHMTENPAVRESLEKLRGWGVGVVTGAATEGESKLATPEEVAAAVLHRLGTPAWSGRGVVVIGGAAREPVDAVRSLTNESSGASAVALAVQAHYRGANVSLWAGAMQVPIPPWIAVERWRSVADLLALAETRQEQLASASVVLVPAALSDFVLERRPGKISSRDHPSLTLTLSRAPKALPALRRLAPAPTVLVGFKLDAHRTPAQLEAEARRLLGESGADWVVANDAATMGATTTDAHVVPREGAPVRIAGTKTEFASRLLELLGERRRRTSGGAAGEGPRVEHRPRRRARRPVRRR